MAGLSRVARRAVKPREISQFRPKVGRILCNKTAFLRKNVSVFNLFPESRESLVLFKRAGILLALLIAPAAVLAQAPRSAVGGNSTLWAGGEISSFNPDYECSSSIPFNCQSLVGFAAFFDFNVTPKWGAEGEARWLHWNGTGGEVESSYLAGGRYRLFRYGRLTGWGRMLAGAGLITTPNFPVAGSLRGSYFALAPGGTVEFPLTDRISLRGDYEYQFWPAFAGPPTYSSTGALVQHNNGLTPNGFSVGLTYRFLGY